MEEITRSLDRRDMRLWRVVVGSEVDSGVKGCGELALAANRADRVVWSTGHWSAEPAVDGCWAGSLDDEASALVLMFEAEAEDASAEELNGHMLVVSILYLLSQ